MIVVQGVDAQAMLLEEGVTIGAGSDNDVILKDDHVSYKHAIVHYENEMYYLEDCGSVDGTFLNGRRLAANRSVQLHPGDYVSFGAPVRKENTSFKVKMMHQSQRDMGLLQHTEDGDTSRMPVCTKAERVVTA